MWIIASFGNAPLWAPALARLEKNFKQLPTEYIGVTHNQKDLEKKFKEEEVLGFISSNPRGFGYWIWKPILLLKVFEDYPNCEGIIYIDAGCELNININSLNRLNEYRNLANNQGLLAFELNTLEIDFTSPYLFNFMNMEATQNMRQCMATTFLIANTDFGKSFLNEWLRIMKSDNFRLVKGEDDDAIRKEIVVPKYYVEHRHDQSIFSMLVKKYGLQTIREESEWYPNWLSKGLDFPIWASRNRLRISVTSSRILNLSYRLIRKTIWLLTFRKKIV